jgi:hypothetical protein
METTTVNARFLGMQLPKNNAHLPFVVATTCIALSLLVGGMVTTNHTNEPDVAVTLGVIFTILGMTASIPIVWISVAKLQTKTALVNVDGELVLDATDEPIYFWRFGRFGGNRTIHYEYVRNHAVHIDIAFGFPTGHTVVLKLETTLSAFGNIQSFLTFAKATGFKGDNGIDYGGGLERIGLLFNIGCRIEDALRAAFDSHRDEMLRLFGTPEGIRPEDGKQQRTVNDLFSPHIEPILKEFGLRRSSIGFSFKTS